MAIAFADVNQRLRGIGSCIRRDSDRFHDSLVPGEPRIRLLAGLFLFLAFSALFMSMSSRALLSADAAVYIQQIRAHDFSDRTIHLGYYLLLFLLTLPFRPPPDFHFNLINCALGGLTVSLVALITQRICGRWILAFLAALCSATSYVIAFNSVFAEVYIGQSCFILLALLCWLLDHEIPAGVAYAVAFLITPSTVFVFPVFALLRPRVRPLMRFSAAAAVPIVLVLMPHLQDYLYGHRGVLRAAQRGLHLRMAVLKEGFEIFSSFPGYLPLVLAGAIGLFTRLRILGIALAVAWLIGFLLGESTGDVPVQLPLHALFGLLVVVGVSQMTRGEARGRRGLAQWLPAVLSLAILGAAAWINRRTHLRVSGEHLAVGAAAVGGYGLLVLLLQSRAGERLPRPRLLAGGVLLLLVLMNAALTVRQIRVLTRGAERYRQTVAMINRVARPPYLVIAGFGRGVIFEHYTHGRLYTGDWIDLSWLFGSEESDLAKRSQSRARFRQAVEEGQEIWLLDEALALLAELRTAGYGVSYVDDVVRARPPGR